MKTETLPDPTTPIGRNIPQTVQDCPILQYANGLTKAKLPGLARFQGLTGFHAERGQDEAFDSACQAANIAPIAIRHMAGNETQHWYFGESLRFYPVTAGPPATTVSACLKTPATADAGIGLAWPAGGRSRLAVRGLVLIGSTPILLQLSVRSTMTGHLLAALLDHFRVCVLADALVDRAKHPDPVAFHELALPLVAGAEVSAGKGETAQIAPLQSDHPSDVQKAYIISCWRKDAIQAAALAAWPGIVAWSAGYGIGETNGDSHLGEAL